MRIHIFFPLLALAIMGIGAADGWQRGLGLFLILTFAVVVRETARLHIRSSAFLHWPTVRIA